MENKNWKSARVIKKNAHAHRIFIKEETRALVKKVSTILKKAQAIRTEDECHLLQQSDDLVEMLKKRLRMKELMKQRHLEIEDGPSVLQEKCQRLSSVLREARSLVIYTGAGISTAASIPDYRGPNGVWTLLKQGKQMRSVDLSDAEPTFTHMAIAELYRRGCVKQVVSQNCDGLHMRSGLPRQVLSELHGNMYIEECRQCWPQLEYIRLFDVTERTGKRRHKTGRKCRVCGFDLYDTIIHFGEKGSHRSPHNWEQAAEAADAADVILCLGSSLKVLKRYPCLWGMHKSTAKRPRLFIVNLQWTPKDHSATMKINGKCDDVMLQVMNIMGIKIPTYSRVLDPIFSLVVSLSNSELKTTTKTFLVRPTVSEPDRPKTEAESKMTKPRRRSKTIPTVRTRILPSRSVKIKAMRLIHRNCRNPASCKLCKRNVQISSPLSRRANRNVGSETTAVDFRSSEGNEFAATGNSGELRACGEFFNSDKPPHGEFGGSGEQERSEFGNSGKRVCCEFGDSGQADRSEFGNSNQPDRSEFGNSGQPDRSEFGNSSQPDRSKFGNSGQPDRSEFGNSGQPDRCDRSEFGNSCQPDSSEFSNFGQPDRNEFGNSGQPDRSEFGNFGQPDRYKFGKSGQPDQPDRSEFGNFGQSDRSEFGNFGQPDRSEFGNFGQPDRSEFGNFGQPNRSAFGNSSRRVCRESCDSLKPACCEFRDSSEPSHGEFGNSVTSGVSVSDKSSELREIGSERVTPYGYAPPFDIRQFQDVLSTYQKQQQIPDGDTTRHNDALAHRADFLKSTMRDTMMKRNSDNSSSGNGCWWNDVDSETWLDALQSYLLRAYGHHEERIGENGGATYPGGLATTFFTSNPPTPMSFFDGLLRLPANAAIMSSLPLGSTLFGGDTNCISSPELCVTQFSRRGHCSERINPSRRRSAETNSTRASSSGTNCTRASSSGTNCTLASSSGTNCTRASSSGIDKKLWTLSDLKTMHGMQFGFNGPIPDPFGYVRHTTPLLESPGRIPDGRGGRAPPTDFPYDAGDARGFGGYRPFGSRSRRTELLRPANIDLITFMHSYCQREKKRKFDETFPSSETVARQNSFRLPDSFGSSFGRAAESTGASNGFKSDPLSARFVLPAFRGSSDFANGATPPELDIETYRLNAMNEIAVPVNLTRKTGGFRRLPLGVVTIPDGSTAPRIDTTSQSIDATSQSIDMTSQSINTSSQSIDATSQSIDTTSQSIDTTSQSFAERLTTNAPNAENRNRGIEGCSKEAEGGFSVIAPGWFGKGLRTKKPKLKRSRSKRNGFCFQQKDV